MPVHVARYSLIIPMIENGIEHETIDTSVITSNKSSEFSRADCGYMIALNFSIFSESAKLFTMVHQVTPSVSFF